MRSVLTLVTLSLLGPMAAGAPAQAEITYPWCAQYGGRAGKNCGFWTYSQCMAALSGNGGFCNVNAMYAGPSPGQIPPPASPPRR